MKYLALLIIAVAAQAQVRYHFGDDPRWADPNFDDSGWTETKEYSVPSPPFESSGFVWARVRVPISTGYTGPLAVREEVESSLAVTPREIWVNGRRAGANGDFPPHPKSLIRPDSTVFELPHLELPHGTASAGSVAVVAVRLWNRVGARAEGPKRLVRFEIGPLELLRLREREAVQSEAVTGLLFLAVAAASLAIGAAVLVLWWRGKGSRELFWFGIFVICFGHLELESSLGDLFRSPVSYAIWDSWGLAAVWAAFSAFAEFEWAAFGLPRRWVLRLMTSVSGVGFGFYWFVLFATEPGWWIRPMLIAPLALFVQIAAMGGIAAWQMRRPGDTRVLAAGILSWIVLEFLSEAAVVPKKVRIGVAEISTWPLVLFSLVLVVLVVLLRRAWAGWREREALESEFEAAREMQESLMEGAVQRLPAIAGFSLESAYRPANQVGGDFYRVLTADEGAILIIVGDVSGKGLKAAMTVSAIAGALDNEFSRDPAQVLARLNRALLLHKRGGFVTCCAALIKPSGEVRIANAGHLAPYADGREVEVEPGLPLGVVPAIDYPETTTTGSRFTFISDGVVEAENPRRELFGFDRTRDISGKSALEIADAAKAWGQNDDITVVTIRRIASSDARRVG